ncbi:Hypothetical predicted protein [Pelobates cultripes]|uniref:Uncharacterized protein n=1 Tax=Pelobates cultripes TaxID=61616 RepID=A0AAD1RJ96_PELCU|nr:Hypothetical predicted protein [Pelobates cultripes]
MSFSQWIYSVFHPERPTLSNLHLMSESQPLRGLQTPCSVILTGAVSIGDERIEETFKKMVSHIGGIDNILLIGASGYGTENDGGRSGILQELSFILFQSTEKNPSRPKDERNEDNAGRSCLQSCVTSKSRIFEFPVILTVFRETMIMNPANTTLIIEMLRDIKLRVKGSKKALVGIIYSQEQRGETNMESQSRLRSLLGKVFKKLQWGVCFYCQSQPETILEVKRTIKETLEIPTRDQSKMDIKTDDLQRSFQDLVHHLGGELKDTYSAASVTSRRELWDFVSEILFVCFRVKLYGPQINRAKGWA